MSVALKSSFLQEAQARGFIYQATDLQALDDLMNQKSITAYIGFDPTAKSLHVGNMASIMLLKLLQKHGHKPLVLLGGATAKIGDPTGKDTIRPQLEQDSIDDNIQAIKKCFAFYLDFKTPDHQAVVVNNNDWFSNIRYLDFLAHYGRFFSVNRMLTLDSIKARLEREQPLSFLEFNYMILQSYDFIELNRSYDCVLQCGGSDQWGNIIGGVELGKKVLNKTLFGLTTPLVTTSNGSKMGKTEKGAVWLNSDMLSAYDYWQFWRNTDDQDVSRYLRLFTDIPLEEINNLEKAEGAALNDVKKILADHTTALLHGQESLDSIHKTVQTLYEKGNSDHIDDLPTYSISSIAIQKMPVEDLFMHVELCASKGEIRRHIQGKGAKINDQVLLDSKELLTNELFEKGFIKLSIGKKKHHILKIID